MGMAVYNTEVTREIFKNEADFDRYSCLTCRNLLHDPVQLGCGHRLCRSCADRLVASGTTVLKCPAEDCDEDVNEEDGAYVMQIYLTLGSSVP